MRKLFLFILPFAIAGCTAPRSMLNSGKVVPKGQVRFGKNYTWNISSAPISESVKGIRDLDKQANQLNSSDSIILNGQVQHINSSLIAYCLDPIGYADELYFRYGLGKRLDFGFKKPGDANTFDVMYQFLGSNSTFNEKSTGKGGFYGSVGLQYSFQNYRFLKYPMFDKVERVFGMSMSRKDFALPIVFSKSFGPEERVGCFSFGLVYTYSFIKYEVTPKNIYVRDETTQYTELLGPMKGKANYGSYGSFINVKIGKKFVFFNFSLAAYYQDYGKYALLGGGSTRFKGVSIVPSYGIQFNIMPKKKKSVVDGTQV
jgi:hypothetical protein